jgi:hypothetical protein
MKEYNKKNNNKNNKQFKDKDYMRKKRVTIS